MNTTELKDRIAGSQEALKALRNSKIDPDFRIFLIDMHKLIIKSNRHLIRVCEKRNSQADTYEQLVKNNKKIVKAYKQIIECS